MANPLDQPRSSRVLLDAGSAPMHPTARATLLAAVDAGWADPRRLYTEARTARRLLDQAREVIAQGMGVRPSEVCFAPNGPTALRLAVEGLRYAGRRRGKRLVASAVEHSAVLVPGREVAARSADPTLLEEVGVDRLGRLDVTAFASAVAVPGTVAAAVQQANGEVGTLQPTDEAHEASGRAGVPLVVDAQASLGRVAPPQGYDVVVGDARSWGGPGAVGVLVLPERTAWALPGAADPDEALDGPTRHTPWVPLALAAAEAWQQTEASREEDAREARSLMDALRAAAGAVPDVEVVGDPVDRLPHVLTFSALYADGEALVHHFDRLGFAVASGSACTASTLEPSHVLAAMGVLTHGNVRVTLPLAAVMPTRAQAVDRFAASIEEVVSAVRRGVGVQGL